MENSPLEDFNFMDVKLPFKRDPKFMYIEEVFKIFMTCMMQNLNLSVELSKTQKYDLDSNELIPSKIFNNLMLVHPLSINSTYEDEVSDNDLVKFCTLFNNYMNKHERFKLYQNTNKDPIEYTFDFLHYLFIPVRLDISSISKEIKINSLRKWLTICFVLPFSKGYTENYVNTIFKIDLLPIAFTSISEDRNKLENMMRLDIDFIAKKTISTIYGEKNSTQIFIRLFANMIYFISIDILKKYCPNISECIRINPNYDGSWLNPYDPMVNEQISSLQEGLTKLFSVKRV